MFECSEKSFSPSLTLLRNHVRVQCVNSKNFEEGFANKWSGTSFLLGRSRRPESASAFSGLIAYLPVPLGYAKAEQLKTQSACVVGLDMYTTQEFSSLWSECM